MALEGVVFAVMALVLQNLIIALFVTGISLAFGLGFSAVQGSGVYVGRQKNLTVSGKTVVAENKDTDVYLDQNARIAVGAV